MYRHDWHSKCQMYGELFDWDIGEHRLVWSDRQMDDFWTYLLEDSNCFLCIWSNQNNTRKDDQLNFPYHKIALDYQLDATVVSDHLNEIIRDKNHERTHLPSWNANILKTTKRAIKTRNSRQHGISKLSRSIGSIQNKTKKLRMHLYKIVYVRDLVSVVRSDNLDRERQAPSSERFL